MEDEHSRSGILRAEFGVNWRNWAWFKRQFTPTSLSAIGVVVLAATGYIVRLSQQVGEQGTKIIVLETQVVPVLQARREETNNRIEIEDLKARLDRMEKSWDVAYQQAGTDPRRRGK